MEEELQADQQRSNSADPRGNEPGGNQQGQARGRQQAAAQVVEDLPAAEQGERVDPATT